MAVFTGRMPRRAAIATSALALVLLSAGVTAAVVAPKVPAPPTVPTLANQVQNIDQVKTAIKGYYGDTISSQVDPVPNNIDGGDVALHFSGESSSYATEMTSLESSWLATLRRVTTLHLYTGTRAIVFDVDDTTLNTYPYEIYSNFVFNPTTNAAFLNAGVFPTVWGMDALATAAAHNGYAIFFVTGRPESQRASTVANLVITGYAAPDADHLFMRNKDGNAPAYLPCDATPPYCTTTRYKVLTRQHLESLGYEIVGNFGDQHSDLNGGHADHLFKVPNPMYYIP